MANQTQGYFTVLEEVGKYNVQLNVFERLWAVCFLPFPTSRPNRIETAPRFADMPRH